MELNVQAGTVIYPYGEDGQPDWDDPKKVEQDNMCEVTGQIATARGVHWTVIDGAGGAWAIPLSSVNQ